MTVADDLATPFRHGRDYIDRTIETVRNHRDADNCWPQWANIFADDIEDYRAALARVKDEISDLEQRLEAELGRGEQRLERALRAEAVAKRWNEGLQRIADPHDSLDGIDDSEFARRLLAEEPS